MLLNFNISYKLWENYPTNPHKRKRVKKEGHYERISQIDHEQINAM